MDFYFHMRTNIEDQIKAHQSTVETLHSVMPMIESVANILIQAASQNQTIFWCGNGGSAADAQHLAAELVGRFQRERRAVSSIALTANTSVITAISNDYGFKTVFTRQLEALSKPRDVLIALSTSGQSDNVNRAVQFANEHNLQVVALTGKDGGELKTLTDQCIIVPSDVTARIQEAHILIGHILCQLVEDSL